MGTWDAIPLSWDTPAMQGKKPNTMIELRISLIALKAEDQASKMDDVKTAITTNAALFPALPVSLATYSAKVAAIKGNLAAIKTKEEELKNLRLLGPGLLAEGRHMYGQNGSMWRASAGTIRPGPCSPAMNWPRSRRPRVPLRHRRLREL